jgi:hypothetical protein
MKRRPLAAIALRCNLFRHKWQPDLCCAVPEHHPVPSFVTGEQWDFGGTWEGPIPPPGLKPTAAEPGLCVDGSHLFEVPGPRERLTTTEHPAAGRLWRGIARRALRIAAR